MADSTFFKGLALWLAGLLALALVVGGTVGFALLSDDRSPPPMDDLRVSNHDNDTHTVAVELSPANGSAAVLSETVRLASDERTSWDGVTENGRQYRLVVAVDDRDPASFAIEALDDLCTTEVWIGANGTVETGAACA